MGAVKQFRKQSRQNRIVEENVQLRHLARAYYTALMEYAKPENWQESTFTGEIGKAPNRIAQDVLGLEHEDSGERCGILHEGAAGHPVGECSFCKKCNGWVTADDAGKMSLCFGEDLGRSVLE
jgi:hypothetical protein